MTSLTLGATLPPVTGRAGFGGALRSEWTKISSLRSTVVTLVATMAVTIGLSTLFAWGATGSPSAATSRRPSTPCAAACSA
jgi:ABC-2 type transport system permease protein